MLSLRKFFISTFVIGGALLSLFIAVHSVQAGVVGCGAACGGSLTCGAPTSCDAGGTNLCGTKYATCVGASCIANNAWDTTNPCNTADACTPGTTRTSTWSAFGTCSATCGNGTQTRTCNNGNENNCTAPGCVGSGSQACCVDNAPQAPVVTGAGNNSCTTDGTVSVTWTFGVGGCGGAWGYACSGASNTFSIVDGVTTIASGIAAGTSPYSQSVSLSNGVHSIKVCANNGSLTTCSNVYSTTIGVDNAAPSIPVLSANTANCSGAFSFSWPDVTDNGCFGNVDYQLQAIDEGVWRINNWVSTAWPINGWTKSAASGTTTVANSSPTIGHVYQAQILSSDNGVNHTNQSAWSGGATWATGVPYCCAAAANGLAPLTTNGAACNGLAGSSAPFPTVYGWKTDPNANGYILNINGCLTNQAVAGGNTSSYTLTTPQRDACIASLSTGTITWTLQATYAGGCSNGGLTSATFNFDKTPPPFPVVTIVPIPDTVSVPNCLDRFNLKYSWDPLTDNTVGCSKLDPSSGYWSQASTDSYVSTDFPINTWGNYSSQTTTVPYAPGKVVTTHVATRDTLNNQSGWSTGETTTIPNPIPYPVIHVTGPIQENIGGVCKPMTITSPGLITWLPAFNPSTKTSALCTASGSTYSCDVTINNQNYVSGACSSPTTTMSMDGSYTGYSAMAWENGCGGPAMTLPLDVLSRTSESGPTLYFTYSNTSSWFKLKDTSFNSRGVGSRTNTVPNNVLPFDGTDDSSHNILSGSSGLLIQNGVLDPGPNARNGSNPIYSTKNWYTSGYTSSNDITYAKYFDYIKARKGYTAINALSDISTDGIYKLSSDTVITDPTAFKGKNVVLVVDGIATFKTYTSGSLITKFVPTTGTVAVLAKKIVINSDVSEIDAILVGQSVQVTTNSGDPASSVGLKIKGNLIDEDTNGLTLNRLQSNPSYPSLFVVFDPTAYINVLPYLSTSTYDWRQIQ